MTNRETPANFDSPSLRLKSDGAGPAYEIKFLIDEARARDVERWASANLTLDPHVEPGLGNAYRVTSLYLDTPKFDVFHRCPPHHRRKLRLRGYGSTATLFLEQKTRKGDRVLKQRTAITTNDLHLLPSPNGADWPGAWFQQRLVERGLRPTLQVSCVRSAFFRNGADGPLRLTLDRHLVGVPNPDWALLSAHGGLPILNGQVVLELKYQNALPALFKQLVADMALNPCPVSKYRLAMQACKPNGQMNGAG